MVDGKSEPTNGRANPSIHVPQMNKLIVAILTLSLASSVGTKRSSTAELWAFTGPWDARSDSSLRKNAAHLDVAITGWIALDSSSARPIIPPLFPDTIRLTSNTRRGAIVTSWHGDRFHPRSIRSLASNEALLARASHEIANHAQSMHYTALVFDFESLERTDLTSLIRVAKTMADSAHRHGVRTIAIAIPAADTEAYPGRPLTAVADLIMPMLYDEHWSTSAPGAISSPDWVRSTLAVRVAEVGPARIVAALPTYGYRWPAKRSVPADVVSFAEARKLAAESHVSLERDARTGTMRAAKPGTWELWVTDADLLSKLSQQVESLGVQRIALWRIGTEDPRAWEAVGKRPAGE